MKKLVLLSALALTASIYADGDVAAQMKSDKQRSDKQMQDQRAADDKRVMAKAVTLTSARPESDNGWYIFADALYWHADVGSSEYAWENDPVVAGAVVTGAVRHLDFGWSWGFRVGLGVNMDHDMWDTDIYYTWFRTRHSNTASDPTPGVVQNFVATDPGTYTSGSVNWKIDYNMFDWELGRWQYYSRNLAMRPHIGVKGGWINQDARYRNSTTTLAGVVTATATTQDKNNFWGVGPSGGVNMMWVLGCAGNRMQHRFTLFGDFAGALLYGHFKVDHSEKTFSAAGVLTGGNSPSNLSRNLAVPVLQTQMGFSWDTAFNNEYNHFMLKVGYEFQYWFRQQQMVKPGSNGFTSQTYARVSDDLALQGLTVDFRFDF
jgi:hypothetical protein